MSWLRALVDCLHPHRGDGPLPTVKNLDERLEQVEHIAAENSRARLLAEARLAALEAGLRSLQRERDLLSIE